MGELDIYARLNEISAPPQYPLLFGNDAERADKIAEHKSWLQRIRKERPSTAHPFKVGIYIRYFNQTRYEDSLKYHMEQLADAIADCPRWTLVDFYVDEGSSPPNMESAPEWCRLLNDCMDGKVDLIITQKLSNVSKKAHEITLCATVLASHKPPIGIYFISEDLFTLASYYLEDMQDFSFFPEGDWEMLPEEEPLEELHD